MATVSPTLRGHIWQALLRMQRLSWEQGVASHAALDAGMGEVSLAIARDAVTHQDADGRLGATGDAGLVNGGSLLEAVAFAASRGDAAAAEALERQRWWFLRYAPRVDSGVLLHIAGANEVWIDTLYMVLPALAVTGDFAPADMQYRMHREHLWNPATGLYAHRANPSTGELVRADAWASGNGWTAAGVARALRIGGNKVPSEMRGRWQSQTRELIDAVSRWETNDGRFHDVLDDPETFTDGTAGMMFAYAAFAGVADGWLPPTYAKRASRWMEGALVRLDLDGVVQGVCGAPHFDREGVSAEAQAFALLALTASETVNDPHGSD